ncbi:MULTISPECIES: hypothetical protein [Pseudomonas]|jgi:uncharacterized membrane protein YidH (DUF202 family)|uniref:Transmembrane protein n=2 Tax=Pseudomonas TaxID=286 RepID=A0AAJ5SD57_9PSED|nr:MULTISPECIES: hypothetical protein [Pseudomonas]MCT8164100.1 hypothetical protein [Pseudomonas sp. HD6422]MCT8182912.1 hypothetical protein [Pseudomonas sp. HD6421]MDH1930382.1 hypothetical protein [Pseudomonas sp. GD03696]MDM1711821.1 hypothetical protein [Pseudomonas sp. 165]ORL53121.1 hypothetical protein B7H18_03825 [Pseudomonas putida]
MSSWNNLKDAGRMLPAWFTPFLLAGATIGLYVIARYITTEQPDELVGSATLSAIVLSLLIGFAFMVIAIAKAKAGNVVAAIGEGFQRGLTFVWVTTAVCLCVYVCATPLYRLLTDNPFYTFTAIGVIGLLGVGYWASGMKPKAAAENQDLGAVPGTALALPVNFTPTIEQRPAFQVTMADQSRLMIHQAARIIAYKGSNCLITDSFSAHLDINARTAKIFSDLNLLSTADMIYWRMHMLLIGSAAEQIILKTASDAAMDDLQNFDDLALRYLQLTNKGNFFKPVSDQEALMKANRLNILRSNVGQRCHAAVAQNEKLIIELVKLMRGRPTLLHMDLKHILDRVQMPEDFPAAEFDSDEAMERVLLQISYDGPEDIAGTTEQSDISDGDFTVNQSNVHTLHSTTGPQAFRA